MSVKLGTLTLDLVARISSFTEPLGRAERQARESAGSISESMNGTSLAVKALGAAVAGISIASVTAFTQKWIDAGSEVQRFATLSNATAQQFQYYAKGAETAGINMEKFADQMKDMQDRIGDFQQTGGGPLKDFFEQIAPKVGVTIQQFQKLSGPEALQLFYTSLEKAGASTNDMKFYMESIISDSSLLIPLLQNGGKGFKEWGDAAQKAGAIMSSDMIASMNNAKESLRLLDYQWQGAQVTMANGLMPVVKAVAGNFDAIKESMTVVGAYIVGAYIPAVVASVAAGYAKSKQLIEQTITQWALINAEKVAAAQGLALAEAQLASNASSIASMQSERARITQLLAGNLTTQQRTILLTELAGVQRVLSVATAETTVLTNAQTVAQQRANAANSAGLITGRGLLSALGGPVGLGLLVAGVAASYLMLRDSTKDTTSTLDLQKGTVSELVAEYSKLDDLQKRTTMRELEKQVKDLSTAYTVSFSDLNAFIGWLEDSGSVSESTAKEVNRLYKEYRTGGISASEFATSINGLSGVQDKHKQKIDDLTTAQAKSKAEYEKVKTAQDALTKQTGAAIKANKDEAESYDAKRLAQEKLIALDKSYAQKNLDIDFSRINIKNHGLEMGKALAEFYDENKLSKTQKLSVEQWAIFQKNFSKQQELKNLENDITQAKKDATKELEKQQKVLQVNAKVQANAAKYNFNGIEGKYGLPSGLLSGVHMQESRGNPNAVGPMTKYGTAKGGFQFLDGTAERFKLMGNDVFDLGKSAEAAAKYFQYLYKKFGNWDEAISAYHAGEGNVAAGTGIGPINRQYVKNVKGYTAGVNGYIGSSKDFDSGMGDQTKYAQKTLDEISQLQSQFDTEAIQRSKERDEQINQATLLGQLDLIPKFQERYNKQELLAAYQLEEELNGYKWGEDQRIAYRRDISKLELEISGNYGKVETDLRKRGLDALAQYEIDEYRKTQQLKIAEYQLAFSQPLTELQAEVLDMQAKVNMGGGYGAWALQNQYGKDLNSLGAEYDKNVNNINEDKTITDDAVRKQMLLDAEESFRLSKLKLNEKYTLLEQDLAKSQQQEQLSLLSGILSNAQTTFSQLTQSAKDGAGEQSAMYRTMFALQQGFSIASSVLAAHTAYTQAFADPSAMTLPQKIAGGMTVMAALMPALATISSVSLQGMAHDGIDNVPKEGTWLLDKGERVVDSRTNGDLKQYLANRQSDGPKVTINNNASVDVSARQNSDGTLTIDVVERFIADSLSQPNSKIRKSLNRNTTATARR